jgi:agmatinase
MSGKTRAIFFPFDLFGSPGTAAGAHLLADAVREMLADNKREQMPTRARAYQDQVSLREFTFETLADYQNWRKTGRQAVRRTLAQNEFLLWVTGNHLGALPIFDELAGGETLVIQLDAHLDVYNLTDCTEELSHGNFLLHCAGPLPPIIHVGHRELLLPAEHAGKYFRQVLGADQLVLNFESVLKQLRKSCQNASAVFIDLDCDVFDAAFFPALAHSHPFGLSPQQVLRLLDAIWSERVIGMSISEFDPVRDHNDRSLATLLWLVEYVLLRKYEARC